MAQHVSLPDEPFEVVVEAAVDNEVHDAVEDEEGVVDVGRADEPDGWHEPIPARDHVVHVEQLVLVRKYKLVYVFLLQL